MYCIKNMDVKITILQVEVANLCPNPWNTNSVGAQNFEKLKGSIEKLGFFKPILARELDGGIFEILGGEHRWRAAMEQGISTVPVISVGKINDLVAKQMSLVDNERYVNNNFAVISRSVVDTQYRGVGVSYRMINLVSRMHDRPIIEIQSSMSKYNPFAMKAGFQFIRPERPKSYESALRVFQRHFRSDPGDNEAIVKELFAMSESRRRRALRDLVADYHKNSSLAKAGRNRGTTIQDIADSLVDEASIVKLLKDIHNLSFTSPLYGVYRNPDFGRQLPDTLPLLAFDKQPLNKPLEIALPA
ncbi:TPA: ParB N-terminal domain-containing protein [Escherichia coli]|nr:ParB N-terminal domain-containing protein [Escherichia coli]